MRSEITTSVAALSSKGTVAAMVPSEITMISADKIKSVRTAPLIFSFSCATKSTLSSALAATRSACSGSLLPEWGQNLCTTFSAPS